MENRYLFKRLARLAGVLFCASLCPISAHAACSAPSGSYAGASAGPDFLNGDGVTGTPMTSTTLYQTTALTITSFPTTSEIGRFKLKKHESWAPPTDPTHNSIWDASGWISEISSYEASTCSGEIILHAQASVKAVNCNTTGGGAIMTCTLGAAQVKILKSRFRFTSSQAGNRVTLTPIGYYAPNVNASYFEMWRQ